MKNKIKLTDYVVDFLAQKGVKHVFGVTGGAVVHLFDSASRSRRVTPIFTHHEQAAALAAEAYARINNKLGAAFVTTGPGGTNALTGLCAAWLDSVPCIYISGQTRVEHTTCHKPIRQLGSQQIDIVSLAAPIAKYAVMIEDPRMIKYELQKAVHIATSGRPGPVWIDIPLNFQWACIEPGKLPGFDYSSRAQEEARGGLTKNEIEKCYKLLSEAKRPLILVGYGVRLGNAVGEFKDFISKTNVPFVSTWNASDILPTGNKLYMGRPGISGQRGANLAVQNCDLLLSIGSHLSIPITGINYDFFAREAKIVVVDIDRVELENKTVRVDLSIQSDAKVFLKAISAKFNKPRLAKNNEPWDKKCTGYKKYNTLPSDWRKQRKYVNPYVFLDVLSDNLGNNDVICVDGGGTALFMSFQGLKIKRGQRLIVSAGIGAMGSGLPESIGACFANNRKRTICVCGDGSMQFNIHELQTIVHHNLPVKIFVFNNSGYLAIRHTQDGFFGSRYVGSEEKGGLSLPDFQKIARAYGIRAVRINNHRGLLRKVRSTLEDKNPVLCEIMISRDQQLNPRMGFYKKSDGTNSPRPLEDMEPLLARDEFMRNMVVKPVSI